MGDEHGLTPGQVEAIRKAADDMVRVSKAIEAGFRALGEALAEALDTKHGAVMHVGMNAVEGADRKALIAMLKARDEALERRMMVNFGAVQSRAHRTRGHA